MATGYDKPGFAAALGAARRDEAWGYEHLFHLVAEPLLWYFRSRGADDPDGVTNEVLTRALTQLHRFEGDESGFRAWVFTIARFRLVDDRRASHRRIRTQALDARSDGPIGDDVEDDAMAALGSDWVAATLDSLAPEQRDVLQLRVVSDLSIAETATVLGKTPGAVKALQHRALASIQRNVARGRIHPTTVDGSEVDGHRPHPRSTARRSFIQPAAIP